MTPENFKMPETNPQDFSIPESELRFSFSRSSGAGGQNVNKVETKATVRWNFQDSSTLTREQKNRLAERLRNRLNEKSELVISSQSERSQGQNRETAVRILQELVNNALTVLPERKPTKPTFSSKRERFKEKELLSRKKTERRYREDI